MGPTEEALKKIVMAINPGMSTCGGKFLPTANEMKRKSGNMSPNMMVPGRR